MFKKIFNYLKAKVLDTYDYFVGLPRSGQWAWGLGSITTVSCYLIYYQNIYYLNVAAFILVGITAYNFYHQLMEYREYKKEKK